MFETGERLGFGAETGRLARAGGGGPEHFQGRQPVQADAPRLVDHAHGAGTDLAQDLVARHHRRRRRGGRRPPAHRGVLPAGQAHHRFVDLEMRPKLVGEPGIAAHVLLDARRLTEPDAEQDFVVDQVEGGVGASRSPGRRSRHDSTLGRSPRPQQPLW